VTHSSSFLLRDSDDFAAIAAALVQHMLSRPIPGVYRHGIVEVKGGRYRDGERTADSTFLQSLYVMNYLYRTTSATDRLL